VINHQANHVEVSRIDGRSHKGINRRTNGIARFGK
jgi:hypothetical protein